MSLSPHQQAAQLLQLADFDPRLYDFHDWKAALVKLSSEEAVQATLSLIAEGKLNLRSTSWSVGKVFAGSISGKSSLIKLMLDHLANSKDPIISDQFLRLVVEIADEGSIVSVIEYYAKQGRSFDEVLRDLIRSVAIRNEPMNESKTVHSFNSVNLKGLRKALFGIFLEEGQTAALAESALRYIDRLRLEYGSAEGEPRHPDIYSGRPWPRIH